MNEGFKLIKPFIEGKDVLDVGCCGWYSQHREENTAYELGGWLHGKIMGYAKSVIGIDISEECVAFLREKGYNVKLANAENFDLNQKFDVIVAADLIEHLSNFGCFLESAQKHLKDGGLLILSTPNVFHFLNVVFLILRGRPPMNPEHTCWFDENTLRQLLERVGFYIIKVFYMTEKYMCTMYKECGGKPLRLKGVSVRLIEKLIPFKKLKYGTIIIIAQKKGSGR